MRSFIRKSGLLLGIVVVTLGIFSTQAASPQAVGQTLNLNFPNSEPDAITDTAPKGPSVGDVYYFRGGITDESGASVGHIFAEAASLTKDGNRVQMTATITLSQGSLSAIGELNFDAADQGTLAIAGGTGDFDGSRGSLVVTAEQDNINIDITLLP